MPLRESGDTICAIASGTGGGVGIIRLSGPEAERILLRLVPGLPRPLESHRLYYGRVRDPLSSEVIDEVLVCVMRGPRSFTGEDVAELHGHGGAANLARLLQAAVRCGARVAEPGEFTRRAFLAGRIDLTQAEAVALVVAARSERALRVAQTQLGGGLAEVVDGLRERLVTVLAEVEARVDFPDERLDFVPESRLSEALVSVSRETVALAESYQRGRALAEGIDVALVGQPNAGKSSLLNALLGEERALVDAAPGTTRDFVEAELDLGGVRAVVVDTAGERETAEVLEQRGLELGRRRAGRADVVVVVVDGTRGYSEVERRLVAQARDAGSRVVLACNKSDLAPAPASLAEEQAPVVAVSARTGDGIEALRQALVAAMGAGVEEDGVLVTSARQRELLEEAGAALAAGGEVLSRGEPAELAAVDLRVALDRLARVTGAQVDEAVLDQVFARFCIGK